MDALHPDQRFPLDQVGTRQTAIDLDSHECNTLVGVVRGRNDYDIPAPSTPGSADYDRQCELFVLAAQAYRDERWPTEYFESLGINAEPTDLARVFTIVRRKERGESVSFTDGQMWTELVNFVGMDEPLDLHHWLMRNVQFDFTVERSGPETCGIGSFHQRNWFNRVAAGAIEAALLEAFQVKYFFKQTRPSTDFKAGSLVESRTCPGHWRYVAGHGAFMGATAELWSTVTDSDYNRDFGLFGMHAAHARTGLGVHLPEDNTQGVHLGILTTRAGA